MSASKTKTKRKRLIIKKKKSPSIKDIYDENGFLTFDPYDDDPDTKVSSKNNIDFDLISRLPKINLINKTDSKLIYSKLSSKIDKIKNLLDESDDDDEETIEDDDNDEEMENYQKGTLDGKLVYYDHDKSLVLNDKLEVIGDIDDEGEVTLDEKYAKLYNCGLEN